MEIHTDQPRDRVKLSRKSSQPPILALTAFLNHARANRGPGRIGSGYLVDNDYVLVENQGKGGAPSQ